LDKKDPDGGRKNMIADMIVQVNYRIQFFKSFFYFFAYNKYNKTLFIC